MTPPEQGMIIFLVKWSYDHFRPFFQHSLRNCFELCEKNFRISNWISHNELFGLPLIKIEAYLFSCFGLLLIFYEERNKEYDLLVLDLSASPRFRRWCRRIRFSLPTCVERDTERRQTDFTKSCTKEVLSHFHAAVFDWICLVLYWHIPCPQYNTYWSHMLQSVCLGARNRKQLHVKVKGKDEGRQQLLVKSGWGSLH